MRDEEPIQPTREIPVSIEDEIRAMARVWTPDWIRDW